MIQSNENLIGEGGFKSVYEQTSESGEVKGVYLRLEQTNRADHEGIFMPAAYATKFQELRKRCKEHGIKLVGDSIENPFIHDTSTGEAFIYDERENGECVVFGHESDSEISLGEFKEIYSKISDEQKEKFWNDLSMKLHDFLGSASLAGIPLVTDVFGIKVNKQTMAVDVFLMDFDNVKLVNKPTTGQKKANFVTNNNTYIDKYIDRIKNAVE
jgi:hypothetical protein